MSIRSQLGVPPGPVRLDAIDTHAAPGAPGGGKEAARAERQEIGNELADLQERLFAEAEVEDSPRRVLLVLQGMDTSGKDGVIKRGLGGMNAKWLGITGFKQPTEEEREHHFLWRIRRALPEPGQIGVFGRSHYEDVIVPRVHGGLTEAALDRRYAEIATFEADLAAGTTTVVKCFLHISSDEQRERLLARLDDPDKRWKFEEGDIEERALWPKYQDTFREVLRRSNPEDAPWYVVPADRKWYRNWAVGRILLETLVEMAPEYPRPALDIPALKARLSPPPRLRAVK
jgi:PPK2 family polyphosphate:nucleotide phosphotransferase